MDQNKNILIRTAIGQMASLGELYDARTDTFCAISALKIAPEKSGAVTIQDNPSIDLQYIHTDTFSDKFDKLEIKAGLKVSILCGLFQLEGSGRYLADTKKSARAVRSSLLYNIQTKAERLNLFSNELVQCFALDALEVTAATHVVVGIDWGANSMITMEYSNSQNKDVKEIEGAIQSELKMFAANISGKASGDYGSGQDSKQTNYSLHIFGDIMPTDEPLPQTIEESLALMKRMPLLVQTANGGKGKPLKYTLVPLSTLTSRLSLPKTADKVIKYIDEQAIVRCVQLFDRIAASKQRLYDLYDFVNSNKYCVPADRVRGIGARKDQLDSDEASLRSKLAELLVEVRSGRAGGDKLEKLISNTNEGSLSDNKIQNFINSNEDIADKITYAKMLQHEGVIYVGAPGHGQSLETAKMERLQSEIYILFWTSLSSDTKDRDWTDNKHHFLRLAKQNNDLDTDSKKDMTRFIAADLDMRPELNDQEHVSSGTRICLFKNGKYIHQNIFLDYITNNDRCLIKPIEPVHLVVHKPNKRVILEIRCPGSLSGYCDSKDEHTWQCYKCDELIEHGFDGYFYCACGKASNKSYQYKCNNNKHGGDFLSFADNDLAKLLEKLRPMKEMNILILGETGVGKSTWINGLVNYMTFKSLDDAEQNKSLSLIASKFTITDENYKQVEVKIGDDKNEVMAAGQSATQEPKAYVLDWGKKHVRLIDTPGIGDTRGLEQDKENFDAILRYISNLDELHGICILLKPNSARLTVMFQFCVKELLTHLHKSASNNIVFCFTNARSTFYRPGETLPALSTLLKENKDVNIELSKHTIYCMDNESFRFLCAIHNGIKFEQDDKHNFSVSWDKSVAETNRLFEHIDGLKPHNTRDTLSLNDARKVILNLTKPMADISKNVQTNIAIINDKMIEITSSKEAQKGLHDKLRVTINDLIPVKLDYQRTVCTSSTCVWYRKIPETTISKIDYITTCHKHCGLSGVKPETYPNAELKNCFAMDANYNCMNCRCSWDKHMAITYENKLVRKEVINQTTQDLINSKKSDEEKVKVFIEELDNKVKALEQEEREIRSVAVKFGSFLKRNAISPYNDSLKDYLTVLIRQEKDKVNAGGDDKILNSLEAMLANYTEEVKVLEQSMASDEHVSVLGPDDINKLVQSLYKLKENGKQLQDNMNLYSASKASMQSMYTETHYNARQYKRSGITTLGYRSGGYNESDKSVKQARSIFKPWTW